MSIPGRRRTSTATGPAAATAIAVAGAALIAVLNGLFAITVGLLAIAGIAAYLSARAVAARTERVSPGRTALAIVLGVAIAVLGALGSWALSLPQGGVAGPLDYIAQTMGPLLALLIAAGALGAWAGGR